MRFLLDRRPDRDSELFAEAAALMDDGLDVDFVLGLYPDDAEWLSPLLRTSAVVGQASESAQPSYFFEGSLKSKFLTAAREGRPQAVPRAVGYQPQSPVRTAIASAGIMVAAGVMGIATLGFVTSDEAVPGDWNYSFKRAQERAEYALARGDHKLDVQIDHAQARVTELRKQGDDASSRDVERLTSVLAELEEEVARNKGLDEYQKSEIGNLTRNFTAVLASVPEKQVPPAVVRKAEETAGSLAAAAGGASSLPSATVTPTPTPSATAEPEETPTATETPAEETPTPTETTTPAPTETETETPTETVTEPIQDETPTVPEDLP